MLLIRRFEERASQQYQAQKIGGFCHLYIGQEAVVTGAVAATRPDDYHHHGVSRSCPCARSRDERGRLHGGTFRQSDRLFARTWRVDALFRQGASHVWRSRHRRRACAARDRDGVRGEISQGGSGHALLFRRRLGQPGRLSRGAESRRALQASDYFHLRKQLLRHGDIGEALDLARAPGRSRRRLRHAGRDCGRDELPRGARQAERDHRLHPQRSAPGLCRGAHLSLSRPFHVRPGELSDEGRTGKVPARRSDHAAARAAHAGRKIDATSSSTRWTSRPRKRRWRA